MASNNLPTKDSKRTGVTIRQFKHGSVIQIDFMYKGVRCREIIRKKPTSKNLEEAERHRSSVISEIDLKGEFFNYAKYFPDSPKVKIFCKNKEIKSNLMSELLNQQLDNFELLQKNGKMSISTLVGYKKIISNQLLPYFGECRVQDLKPLDIKKWIIGQGVSAKTMRNRISLLKIVLDEAKNDEFIEKNPLDQLALARLLDTATTESDYVVEPFNEQEKQAIIDTATGQIKNLFQFNLWAGLRTSELLALSWDNIDFENGIIHITKAKVENTEKTTKTKAGIRKILMLPQAREALERQLQYRNECEYVFQNPNTNKQWANSTKIGEIWRKTLDNANVKYRNSYQMRHTYASTLLSNNENIFWVATQMGHENTEMIFKHYGKWIPENQKNGYTLVGKY